MFDHLYNNGSFWKLAHLEHAGVSKNMSITLAKSLCLPIKREGVAILQKKVKSAIIQRIIFSKSP